MPNHLLDGGVTGLSIIAAHLTGAPLGIFLALFNIPFVILGYRKFGKEFAMLSIIGIIGLAALTIAHTDHGLINHQPLLAAVFGGGIVGVGVGIVLRYGGVIDGADTIAVLVDRRTIFSVSEAIMAISGVIIISSGFVFGWDSALYSLIAYYVAHKAIDSTVEGLNEDRCMWIVSKHTHEIGDAINELIDEPVTYIREPNDNDPNEPHGMMLAVILRFDEQQIKNAIRKIDPHAYVVITRAHEVLQRVSQDTVHKKAHEVLDKQPA